MSSNQSQLSSANWQPSFSVPLSTFFSLGCRKLFPVGQWENSAHSMPGPACWALGSSTNSTPTNRRSKGISNVPGEPKVVPMVAVGAFDHGSVHTIGVAQSSDRLARKHCILYHQRRRYPGTSTFWLLDTRTLQRTSASRREQAPL